MNDGPETTKAAGATETVKPIPATAADIDAIRDTVAKLTGDVAKLRDATNQTAAQLTDVLGVVQQLQTGVANTGRAIGDVAGDVRQLKRGIADAGEEGGLFAAVHAKLERAGKATNLDTLLNALRS